MDNLEKFDRLRNEALNKLSEGISTIIMSIDDKNEIVKFLKSLPNEPSSEVLQRINKIAIGKEHYETCEALKEYSNLRGINLT